MYKMFIIFSASSFGVFWRSNLFYPRISMLINEYIWDADVKYNLVLMCLQFYISALLRYFQRISYDDFSIQNIKSTFIFSIKGRQISWATLNLSSLLIPYSLMTTKWASVLAVSCNLSSIYWSILLKTKLFFLRSCLMVS